MWPQNGGPYDGSRPSPGRVQLFRKTHAETKPSPTCSRAGRGIRWQRRAGAGQRLQDRADPADDRPAGHHRPPDRGGCPAVHAAERRHRRRQENPADRQGRHQSARRDASAGPGTGREREGQRAGRLRHHALGHRHRADRHPVQDAASGHGRGDLEHHRGVPVHRAHQLHAAAGVGRAGRLGAQERHQEGRDAGQRLRSGHRCREVFQGAAAVQRRPGDGIPARAPARR
jgi:hypothetical protein